MLCYAGELVSSVLFIITITATGEWYDINNNVQLCINIQNWQSLRSSSNVVKNITKKLI